MERKTLVILGICGMSIISFCSGCINIPDELTQFSIMSFDVEPSIINQGEYANLSWVVLSAASVDIDNGIGAVALTGHRMIQPNQTTTYTLTAKNATITKTATATITVHSEFNESYENHSGNRIAVIDTSFGVMKIELYEEEMPMTTANFIRLANNGFYNGLIFHRIGEGFMIQGGGYYPNGTLKSSPYGSIAFETSNVKHVNGAISMASTGAKVGGSTQFFICDGAQTFLDGNYAAFGVIIEGFDVLQTIAAQPHTDNGDGTGKPITDIIIDTITIVHP